MWVNRIQDGYPLSIIRANEHTRDGRQVYLGLVTHFESKNNLDQLSLLTFNKLTELTYHYKYPGGLPKFLAKFRDLIMDLKDTGRDLEPDMIKSMFLSKILDKEYKHLVDDYINNTSLSFEDCAQNLLDKYERLIADRPTNSTRNTNNAQSNSSGKAVTLSSDVLAQWRKDWRLPKHIWKQLTQGQKDHLINIRNKEKKPSGDTSSVPSSNYSNNDMGKLMKQLNNLVTILQASTNDPNQDQSSGSSAAPPSGSTSGPNVRDIMRARAGNKVTVIPSMSDTPGQPPPVTIDDVRGLNQLHLSQADTTSFSLAPVDSGADTCLLGRDFYIQDVYQDRCVDVEGFHENVQVQNIPIGSGLTVCELQSGESILLQVNEGVAIGDGKTLLSTNQMRHHGHLVHDVPHRYAGKQCLISADSQYTLPMEYSAGVCALKIRHPTPSELESLPILELTSPELWCPLDGESDPFDGSFDPEDPDLREMNNKSTKPKDPDWEHIRACLGWKPLDVVKKTYLNTTQYATSHVRMPMRDHFKSRFPALNVRRIDEPVATDTFFSSVKALDGETCAQLYCGKYSFHTKVYGMKTESQMPDTLGDYIREIGAPYALISDNAKSETSEAVKAYLRKYCIKDMQTEPMHPNQNPAERRIQEVKKLMTIMMDRTNSPSCLWYLCLAHGVDVLNHLSHETLDGKTPQGQQFGVTPDISALIQFPWYQPILYYDTNAKFPESREKFGHFVGIAHHVGDALTYKVLTEDMSVINRSVVRPVDSEQHPNLRAEPKGQPEEIKAFDTVSDSIPINQLRLPHIQPEDLIGFKFVSKIGEDAFSAQVKEKLEDERYLVSFGDGQREEVMSYNTIMEHVNDLNMADSDGMWTFEKILDHRKGKHKKFEVLVKWSTGEETWEPLSVIGDSDPVTCGRYAKDNNLLNTPQWKRFKRYSKDKKHIYRLHKQIKLQNAKRAQKFKFGIQIPRTYKEAMALDAANGNTLWGDAIAKEMSQIKEYDTFIDKGKGAAPPEGYKKITVHLVFDVKYDLRRKARLVAGGHLTDPTHDRAYSGIASIRSIRLCLFAGELNDLQQCALDVGNAYLEAFSREKIYIIAGPEFGELCGHLLVVNKALYGLRTSGFRWAEVMADCLRDLGWFQCKADPAIWMKDAGTHWEYICAWVDDLLILSKDPMAVVNALKSKFTLKGVGKPEYYLGADMAHRETPETVFVMGSTTYVKKILSEFERIMGYAPKKGITSPLEPSDHPELDNTELLSKDDQQKYWSLIGMLQWAVTLGRIDIAVAVSTMGRFRAEPRMGHLERLARIFGHLRNYKDLSIKFRVDMPDYSGYVPQEYDWEYVYHGVSEELPADAPEPKGKPVVTSSFADASLYHCKVTGRAITGVIHMLNKTPIDFYTKRQGTVETSTYGAEFVAGRICVEQIIALRYELRMMGIPIVGPSYMFGDNESVVISATIPESNLKKRHVALAYHRVREAVAAGIVQFYHIRSEDNPADVLTKFLPAAKWWPLLKPLLHWQAQDHD